MNGQSRVPGLTHSGDEIEDSDPHDEREAEEAQSRYQKFGEEVKEGKLVDSRDSIKAQEDFHLRRPNVHSVGWRYVLNAKETWIKNVENWPANIERKKKEEEAAEGKKNQEAKTQIATAERQMKVRQRVEFSKSMSGNGRMVKVINITMLMRDHQGAMQMLRAPKRMKKTKANSKS